MQPSPEIVTRQKIKLYIPAQILCVSFQVFKEMSVACVACVLNLFSVQLMGENGTRFQQ